MIFTRPAWPAGPRMAVDFAGLRRNWHNRGSVGKKCRLRVQTATCTLCFSATMKMKTLKIRKGGTHFNLSYSFPVLTRENKLRTKTLILYHTLSKDLKKIEYARSHLSCRGHWTDSSDNSKAWWLTRQLQTNACRGLFHPMTRWLTRRCWQKGIEDWLSVLSRNSRSSCERSVLRGTLAKN